MRGRGTRRSTLTGLAVAVPGALLLRTPGTAGGQGAPGAGLAPAGALRVAVTSNPAVSTKDPGTGEWSGVWIDLARAVAQRVGAPVVIVEYASDAARDAATATGAWDIASTVDTPEQAAALGRTVAPPYLEIDNTLVVGPDSPLRGVADMDRPGVRIGALSGIPPERALSARVTRAEVVRVTTGAELVALLATGQVDALGANRASALGYAAQIPGARVLADRYAVQQQRITLAAGRPATALALAADETRQALTSGRIRASIARHGAQGVQPAPVAAGGLPRTGAGGAGTSDATSGAGGDDGSNDIGATGGAGGGGDTTTSATAGASAGNVERPARCHARLTAGFRTQRTAATSRWPLGRRADRKAHEHTRGALGGPPRRGDRGGQAGRHAPRGRRRDGRDAGPRRGQDASWTLGARALAPAGGRGVVRPGGRTDVPLRRPHRRRARRRLRLLPPGVAHAFGNAGERPARYLELFVPGGFEGYLVERAALEGALPPVDSLQYSNLDEETLEALRRKYGGERVPQDGDGPGEHRPIR